jgi:hypothetical protein
MSQSHPLPTLWTCHNKIYLNVILPSSCVSFKWLFTNRLSHQIMYTIIVSPILATWPAHRSIQDVTALTLSVAYLRYVIFVFLFKSRGKLIATPGRSVQSLLRNTPYCLSPNLGANIFPSTSFSDTCNLWYFLKVRGPRRWLSSGLLRRVAWLPTFERCLLPPSSGWCVMMDVASTSDTSVNFYQTTRRNNAYDSHIHNRSRENLKSH